MVNVIDEIASESAMALALQRLRFFKRERNAVVQLRRSIGEEKWNEAMIIMQKMVSENPNNFKTKKCIVVVGSSKN